MFNATVDRTVNTSGCSVNNKSDTIPASEAVHKLKLNGTFVESFAPVMAPVPTPEAGRPMPPVPANATWVGHISKGPARPVPAPYNLEVEFATPAGSTSAIVKLDFDRGAMDPAAYWENPGQWRYFLASQMALALGVDKRRIDIVSIDPINFTTVIRFKQLFADEAATGRGVHAEYLAKLFSNLIYGKRLDKFALLAAIDVNKPVQIDVQQVMAPATVPRLIAQLKIAADVPKLVGAPGGLAGYAQTLMQELVGLSGVSNEQIQLVSLEPWLGVSVTEVLARVRFLGKSNTYADETVNPLTAIMRVKRAMEKPDSPLYKLPVLKGVDATFPIQRDPSEGRGPAKPWFNDTRYFKVPQFLNTPPVMNTRPIIIPTLLVASPVNQTYTRIPKRL